MTDKPQIQYVITERHYCLLAQLNKHGTLRTCLGQARFLQAICPLVWPRMRLLVSGTTPESDEASGAEEPVIVRASHINERDEWEPICAPGEET